MGVFANKILGLIAEMANYVYVLVALSLFVVGLMFIWPDEQAKSLAKRAIPWIFIGGALALTCVTVAKSMTSGF